MANLGTPHRWIPITRSRRRFFQPVRCSERFPPATDRHCCAGYDSDVEVSIGPWKWIRLDPASLPEDGLAGVTLREPRDLHELIEKHSQYDAPLPLAAVVEDP